MKMMKCVAKLWCNPAFNGDRSRPSRHVARVQQHQGTGLGNNATMVECHGEGSLGYRNLGAERMMEESGGVPVLLSSMVNLRDQVDLSARFSCVRLFLLCGHCGHSNVTKKVV